MLAVVTIASTVAAVYAKSEVAGGYDTGFARGAEEAHKAIAQFNNGQISTIDGNKPPPCPLADKQDDYCDGWKDGWEKTVVKELASRLGLYNGISSKFAITDPLGPRLYVSSL